MSTLRFLLCSVYSGHQSVLIPPMELENNLFLWLATVNQYKIRDTFCSYSVMELCTKGLGNQVEVLKVSKPSEWPVLRGLTSGPGLLQREQGAQHAHCPFLLSITEWIARKR